MDLQGPTGHMAACDQTQIKRMSQDPGRWPLTRWHHSFPSFIEAPCASPHSLIGSSRRLLQDPARNPQGFPLASTRELPGMIPQGDDSLGSDGLGAAHQEHWPMAIYPC